MRVTRGDIDYRYLIAADVIFDNIGLIWLSESYNTSTLNDDELFVLGIMPMVTFGDTGLGNVNRKLTRRFCS